jgi:Flp pilus assembly protein protease CpaA
VDPLTPQAAAVAVGCVIATYTDVRWGKIYNWTTGTMVALGLAMNTSLGQWQLGVIGLLASFAVHYGLFRLGIQKGGDAKLVIGIGTLLGAWFMVETTLWYGILYLPVGLAFLAVTGRLGNLVAVLRYELARRSGQPLPAERPADTMMRTAPVIAAAALAAFATPWLHFILFEDGGAGPVSIGN